ncbi:MAG TPA: AAA family ATPase [Actinomycetota bacterium]
MTRERPDHDAPELDGEGVPWPSDPPPLDDPPEAPPPVDDPPAEEDAPPAEDAGGLATVYPLHPPTATTGLSQPAGRGLVVEDLAAVLARVDAAGPPAWLVEGLWPRDAYGVFAAEDKAGKTWANLDLAISVAAGVPWLGRFACPSPGRVLVFLGEGGERATVRRLRAIAAHKGVDLAGLAARGLVRLCFRVPRLTSGAELKAVAAELADRPAALVVLDPLYLAVGTGGAGADLYAMGTILSGIQGVCQQAGAALVVVTHWNKTGEGRGARRISGVGPGAWGRVLASAGVAHRVSAPDGTSTVVLAVEVVGGEIPDQSFRVRRQVRAEDPGDLASPLYYHVEVLDDADPDSPAAGPAGGLSPSRRLVLAALREGGPMQTVKQLGDYTAARGHPLKPRTIQEALGELEAAALAEGTEAISGLPRYWSATDPPEPPTAGEPNGDGGPS